MDTKQLVDYWNENGEEKWKTAEGLMEIKRYADALFFCHLAIEAYLKAFVVLKTGDFPPPIHDLVNLAFMSKLPLSQEQEKDLSEISTFNIRARYDDYKFSFYKKATEEYARRYRDISKDLIKWIKEQKA